MRRLSILLILLLLALMSGCYSTSDIDVIMQNRPTGMPLAKRGSVLEVVSPAEILIEAYGEFYGSGKTLRAMQRDVDEQGTEQALLDARRTSIYVLLFEGSDPLLTTSRERTLFQQHSSFFYNPETLRRYITYEDTQFKSRIYFDEKTAVRVVKRFKVHKDRLLEDLVERRILVSRDTLMSTLGNPIIMVMPEAETNQSPLEVLASDNVARQATTVIQSYLTSKGYEVVVPEQSAEIAGIVSAQHMLQGAQSDYAYELALSIGSDIYLTVSGYSEGASYGTSRYVATVNAYETTTARLLGSETGYSKERKGDVMVSVEEALNSAVDMVMNRIMNYWKEDISKGVQYKVIVSLPAGLDAYDIDSMHIAFMHAVKDVAKSSRELILTQETMDYILWVDPVTYDRALLVYQSLKRAFEQFGTGAVLERSSMNRKLMQLTINY